MKNPWPKERLGQLLHHRKEFVTIDDLAVYRRPRVQLHAQGIVLRDEVPGALVKTKQQQVCRAGELLVAEIDAKLGGIGIVPDGLGGAIVSSHYFLFEIDEPKLDRRFLAAFVQTRTFLDQIEAQGSTNYAAIRPADVLGYEIPLPPIEEQRRVVARVEELAAKIHEACALRQQAEQEVEMLLPHVTAALVDNAAWPTRPLGEVLAEPPRNGLAPRPEAESGGRPMLRINSVSSSPTRFVDLSAVKNVHVSDEEARPFLLQHDDVFIVRYNGDIARVAKPAIYKRPGECHTVFPDKLMRLRPRPSTMLPDFLVFALSSRNVREQIERRGKTTAGNIGVSGKDANSLIVAVPPLHEQRRIVTELDVLQADVDALKRVRAKATAELDALLPAILDRAFKGEL